MLAYPKFYFQWAVSSDFEVLMHKKTADYTQKGILCHRCQHWITTPDTRIIVQGQHQHIVTNPSGIEFELGCFSTAVGVIEEGIPTLEHTWFKGFAWRFGICGNCFIHLGWAYSAGETQFYGLILKKLIDLQT